MISSLKERLTAKLTVELFFKIMTVCVCLTSMAALQAWLQRHWGVFSHAQQREAILVLVMYPIPCLHFLKRFQNPLSTFFLVFMTYSLLSMATDLIFR
jgi:hypothetical protein